MNNLYSSCTNLSDIILSYPGLCYVDLLLSIHLFSSIIVSSHQHLFLGVGPFHHNRTGLEEDVSGVTEVSATLTLSNNGTSFSVRRVCD